MKYFLIVLLLLIPAKTVKAEDLLILATALCEYTKVDDKNEIRKRLKKAGVKLRSIYDDIKCNDMTLHAWAVHNGATRLAEYYAKQVKENI